MSNMPPSDFKARFTSSFSLFISSISIHKNIACILSRLGDKVYLPIEDIQLVLTARDLVEEDLFLSFSSSSSSPSFSSSFFSPSSHPFLPQESQKKKKKEKVSFFDGLQHQDKEKKRKEEEERAREDHRRQVKFPCDLADAVKRMKEEKTISRYSLDGGVEIPRQSFYSSSSSLSRDEQDTCSTTTASQSGFTPCCSNQKSFLSSSFLIEEEKGEKRGSKRHTGIGANTRERLLHDAREAGRSRRGEEKEEDKERKGLGEVLERHQQWSEVKRLLDCAHLPLASVVQVWQVFLHALALCREEEKRGFDEYKKRLRRRLGETLERMEKEESEAGRKNLDVAVVKDDKGRNQTVVGVVEVEKRKKKRGSREKERESKEAKEAGGEEEKAAVGVSIARIRREVYQSVFPITVKKQKKKQKMACS